MAEIRNPYVVDEKPQVIFGDSAFVESYHGLENYTADYVNGYAHISFTYTHHTCCFSSYPPIVYVTNFDPRATSTIRVKSSLPAYLIGDGAHNPSFTTDWYRYDIKFDATGYSVVVKKRGEVELVNEHWNVADFTNTDWTALANLYPLVSPPFEPIHSMSFTPIPIREPASEELVDPIIIIPGIMGSAYKNGGLVIDPILHTYDDLIATLIANGYIEGVDLFTFPYEWRNSNVITALLLRDKINEVKAICTCQKVDIVAHSMGGLVARQYIQSDKYNDDIDQLIFLGTPHKGAPTDYLRWEAGEFPSGRVNFLTKLFFEAEAKRNGFSNIFDYIHGRPILSVQELLPVFNYLKDKDTGIIRVYPNNYPQNVFLENLNNNVSGLLNSGVKINNIIGNTGSSTIEKIRVVPSEDANLWIDGKPDGFNGETNDRGLENGIGDGTVTNYGSTIDSSVSKEEWSGVSHTRLPRETSARIFNLLTGKTADTVIFKTLIEKLLSIQLQSPIDMIITSPDGRKMGKNFTTGEEFDEIPDGFYSGYNNNDDEYITIPNPLDGEYKIEVQGTGSGGEYKVLTSLVSDDTSNTEETAGLIEAGQITILDINVDQNNPESLSSEKIVTSEVLMTDILKSYELGWIKDKKLKDKLVKKVEKIIKIENKEKDQEKAEEKIDKEAAKALKIEMKGYKRDKINEQAYNIIKEDLEWLINN